MALPARWTEHVNGVQTETALAALRGSVARGAPYGDDAWQERTVAAMGLE
jgi:hypothetical protein